MSKVLFIIPTIMNRPDIEISNVEKLATEYPEERVCFVSNIEDDGFNNYVPKRPNIEKYVSGLNYNISKALNTAIKRLDGERYICFLQSDFTLNGKWVEMFINICEDEQLNTGVIGARNHSTFAKYNKYMGSHHGIELYKVLWSDGVMFFKSSLIDEIGMFDEDYFGDTESADFCYRAHDKGYNNFCLVKNDYISWYHNSTPFSGKVKNYKDREKFANLVKESAKLFLGRWTDWMEQQKIHFGD